MKLRRVLLIIEFQTKDLHKGIPRENLAQARKRHEALHPTNETQQGFDCAHKTQITHISNYSLVYPGLIIGEEDTLSRIMNASLSLPQ